MSDDNTILTILKEIHSSHTNKNECVGALVEELEGKNALKLPNKTNKSMYEFVLKLRERESEFNKAYVIQLLNTFINNAEIVEIVLLAFCLLDGYENGTQKKRFKSYVNKAFGFNSKIKKDYRDSKSIRDITYPALEELSEKLINSLPSGSERLNFSKKVIAKLAKDYPDGLPDKFPLPKAKFVRNDSDVSAEIQLMRSNFANNAIEKHSVARGNNICLRPLFTVNQINSGYLGNRITFNSIYDSGPLGDTELNFVGVRENTHINLPEFNKWETREVIVKDGREYIIRMYVHNNRPDGYDGAALDTKVAFSVPAQSDRCIEVCGLIESSNAHPSKYWSSVMFKSMNPFHLEYIYGSAILENNGIGAGTPAKLSDEITTSATTGGVLIGYNALDGVVPGCYQYANYVCIRVKAVVEADFRIVNEVRLIGGEKKWADYVIAEIGDIVEFRISYKNISEYDIQDQVAIRNILPKSLEYVPNTTKLTNASHPNSTMLTPGEAITTDGINIGNYTAGSNAYVYLRAKVVEDGLAYGKNTLVSWAQGGVGDKTIQDYAGVITYKNSDASEHLETNLE